MAEILHAQGRCVQDNGNLCQFDDIAVHEHEGRSYCALHAPIGAVNKFNPVELDRYIGERLANGKIDICGVVFPPSAGNPYHIGGQSVSALRCRFEGSVSIQINSDVDMSGSCFNGYIEISKQSGNPYVRHAKFNDSTSIHSLGGGLLDLTGSEISGEITILLPNRLGELNLSRCEFSRAPVIGDVEGKGLPQNTKIFGARFRSTAFADGAEARYRVIRNWFTKSLSALYDWVAGYGQSYERSFIWLVGLQMAFGVLYSQMSGRFSWGGKFDSQLAAFTFAQIVKPFELLSARRADVWPYTDIYIGASGWWTVATIAHSLLSLIVIALFLLAVRWRFRRD